MRSVAAAAVLLVVLLGACQNAGGTTTANQDAVAPTSAATATGTVAVPTSAATGTVAVPTGKGVGTPKADPCRLLTKGMAQRALGLEVGPPTTTTLPGNVTCSYIPADGRPNVFALLTTYAASGKAALATATTDFPDAVPVLDLGDDALVSRRGHAIGVSVGELLFAMSLLRPDGLSVSPAVSEARLIALARTVVQSR